MKRLLPILLIFGFIFLIPQMQTADAEEILISDSKQTFDEGF
jgi:hypothetical protein